MSKYVTIHRTYETVAEIVVSDAEAAILMRDKRDAEWERVYEEVTSRPEASKESDFEFVMGCSILTDDADGRGNEIELRDW